MKVLVMIGNSMIGKYCAGQFVNNLNVCGIIVENKKVNKFKSIKKKLKKNPFLFPYKFVEAGIISFYNRIISKKINNYFKDIKLDSYNVKNINSKDVQKIITSLKPDIGIIVGTSIPVTSTDIPVLLLVTSTELFSSEMVTVLLDVFTVVDIIKQSLLYLA